MYRSPNNADERFAGRAEPNPERARDRSARQPVHQRGRGTRQLPRRHGYLGEPPGRRFITRPGRPLSATPSTAPSVPARFGDPHRVMAGTNRGFDTFAGMGRVTEDV